MECEVCPVLYRCRFFKSCPFEVDDTQEVVKGEFCGPIKEEYVTSLDELPKDFMSF